MEEEQKAKLQFQDGNNKRILIGEIIEEDGDFITIECDNAVYEINKSNIDWIKRPKEEIREDEEEDILGFSDLF